MKINFKNHWIAVSIALAILFLARVYVLSTPSTKDDEMLDKVQGVMLETLTEAS